MTSGNPSDRERWARVAAICDAALSLDGAARAEYIRRECRGDTGLRRDVDTLLERAGSERGFLSSPAAFIGGAAPLSDLSGQRLGDFDILARLGAGGMGVVYRAHDRTLGRDVALKVLPEEVATDAERLSRFRREAKLLAAVSHPNIGAIYGFVEANGKCALVLELLAGETLAAALARRPMSVGAAMIAARQILDALEHAHRRGVTHRDLKPSNLMLTQAGIKLLDFGIGKLTVPTEAARPAGFSTDTADGHIRGTPNYMSPEQLEGRPADARSDLFAFGALFHEMLSGRPVFTGDSQASIVASVLTTMPGPLTSSTGDPISPALDRIIAKCLAKDPDARWQTARDLRDALGWIQNEPRLERDVAPRSRQSGVVAAVLFAVMAIIAVAGWASLRPRPSTAGEVSRLVVNAPEKVQMEAGFFDISPDGRQFVYRTQDDSRLMIRRLDDFEHTVVHEPGGQPAFSPDGKSIAVFTRVLLSRKRLAGDGGAVTLAEIPGVNFDFNWSVPDTITFSGRNQPIRGVPAAGGQPTPLTTIADGEIDHHASQILPGGRAMIFAIHRPRNRFDVAVQRLGATEHTVLIEDAFWPRYSPSGHLLFGRGATLFAVPFDIDRLQATGAPVTVVQSVASVPSDGTMHYRVSASGTLVYQPPFAAVARTLVWMDRKGTETRLPLEPGLYEAPRISPDGTAIAFNTQEPWRVWRYDIAAQRLTPLTPASEKSWGPVWSSDSKAIYYARDRPDRSEIVIDRLDGSAPVAVGSSINDLWPTGFTDDGALIAFEDPPTNNSRISRLVPGPNAMPVALADGPSTPFASRPSPDGLWVAFAAQESGRLQLFIQPGSGHGVRRQITVDGGREAVWSQDGKELFIRNRGKVLAVPVVPGKALSWGRPVPLFEFPFADSDFTFDAAGDGRLLMVKGSSAPPPEVQLNVVVNWATELRSRAAPSR